MKQTTYLSVLWFLVGFCATVACWAADPPVETGEKQDTLLYVSTTPSGAKVLLDGKELGKSDGVFSVEPGAGTVVVELEGYQPNSKKVTIRSNGITRVKLALKTKAQAEQDGKPIEHVAKNILMESPESWEEGAPIPGVKYSRDEDVKMKGKASLCIEKTENRYFPIAQWSQTVDRTGDSRVLNVSAQVKAEKMTKAVLDVLFLDKDDQWILHKWAAYIGAKKAGQAPANHDWKQYAGKVDIPPGAAKLCIALQVYGPGKVWFDDVQARYGIAPVGNVASPSAGDVVAEGVGWSDFRVGATRKELVKAFGEPDPNPNGQVQWVSWKSRHHVDCLIAAQRGAFEIRFNRGFKFALASGVKIGSTEKEVLNAYGSPDRVVEEPQAKMLEYDDRGVLMWLMNGKVSQFTVFTPRHVR